MLIFFVLKDDTVLASLEAFWEFQSNTLGIYHRGPASIFLTKTFASVMFGHVPEVWVVSENPESDTKHCGEQNRGLNLKVTFFSVPNQENDDLQL